MCPSAEPVRKNNTFGLKNNTFLYDVQKCIISTLMTKISRAPRRPVKIIHSPVAEIMHFGSLLWTPGPHLSRAPRSPGGAPSGSRITSTEPPTHPTLRPTATSGPSAGGRRHRIPGGRGPPWPQPTQPGPPLVGGLHGHNRPLRRAGRLVGARGPGMFHKASILYYFRSGK